MSGFGAGGMAGGGRTTYSQANPGKVSNGVGLDARHLVIGSFVGLFLRTRWRCCIVRVVIELCYFLYPSFFLLYRKWLFILLLPVNFHGVTSLVRT